MPTINPRLTITLDESTALQLRRLSELTGNSQSRLVSELLQESGDVFARTIVVLEAAERAKQALKTVPAGRLASAQGRVEAGLGVALPEPSDTVTMPLFVGERIVRRGVRQRSATPAAGAGPACGEGSGRRGSSAAGAPENVQSAPLSNRGVRSKNKGASHGQI